jgi:glycosyltransferase involved in cell wall biosynthesis
VGADGHRVDVIVPTRNRPRLTVEAVDAVRSQTFTDWHLWVVDDASDDDTVAHLARHLDGDRRVTILRRGRRGGANPTRQTAFEVSDAALVATCDSDDLWEPTKLARQVDAWDTEHRRSGRVGPVLSWHDAVDAAGVRRGDVLRPRRSRRWHPFTLFNTSTALVSRELLIEAGGFAARDPYPLRTTDHLDLFLRLTRGHPLVVVPEVLVHCRHHHGPRNSDGERTLDAAEEAEMVLRWFDAELAAGRPATRAWLHAAVAGRYLESGAPRRAAPFAATALRAGGPGTSTAILAHYGPWALRRQLGRRAGR